jgi:hypothetical protein
MLPVVRPDVTTRTGAGSPSRRRFLAIAGGALALAAGGVAAVRTRGYVVPAEVAAKLEALSAWQYVVVQSVARRIAAPDRDDAAIPTADDTDVAGFVDGYVARLPPAVRRDLLRALAFVEHLAPLGVGCASRFTRLAAADQDRVLASLESNGQDLLRGAFDGLKSLVFMGYYRDPRTWRILSYDGPRVNRPDDGWWKP